MPYTFNPFTNNFDAISKETVTTVDTKANILALTPASPQTAFATDTSEFFVYDGTNWQVASIGLSEESANPDMGYTQKSDKAGYTKTYITDKYLHNVVLQGNAREENGAIRIDVTKEPDTLEVYLRGVWQSILYDLTAENGDFRHTPLTEPFYIWRGDSVAVGLNGQPMFQEYTSSMGAYPPKRIINGGDF
ncbi:hypothetical protein KDA08_05485 [Candidatus Saccharibacteria bacterium]|nr:hypothetical protein [Candidatus Saccharibacteria bacterium]